MVEAWQADPAGRYDAAGHPSGLARAGTCATADVRAIVTEARPRAVAGRGLQAPHLALGVFARGLLKRLATRLYFPDEAAANGEDPVLGLLAAAERATLVAAPEDGWLRFDIRLQGPGQTTFFAV